MCKTLSAATKFVKRFVELLTTKRQQYHKDSSGMAKIYSKNGITSNAIAIGLAKTAMSTPELETKEGKNKVSKIPVYKETIDKEYEDAWYR